MPRTRRLASRSSADRDRRKELAETNAVLRSERTDEQELARLDEMFGVGLGAVRERSQLASRIAATKSTPKPVKSKKKTVEHGDKAKVRRKSDKKRKS